MRLRSDTDLHSRRPLQKANTTTIDLWFFSLAVLTFGLSVNQTTLIKFRSDKLTTIAVLARPAWQALAEVSTNQVAAGPGVDAGAVRTLVGILGQR